MAAVHKGIVLDSTVGLMDKEKRPAYHHIYMYIYTL